MKKLALLPILILTIASSASCQKNDFKYQGELPQEKYFFVKSDGTDITLEDGNTIPVRNRIYIKMDEAGTIFLNGHPTPLSTFKDNFKYVLTNPGSHGHLPENVDSAFVFSNILDMVDPFNLDVVVTFKMQHLAFCIHSVYQEQLENYMEKVLKKSWEEIDSADVSILTEKFTVKIATPQYEQDLGINLKLPEWEEEELDPAKLKARNVLRILVNDQNQILIGGEMADVSDLRQRVKEFIMNPDDDPELSISPQEAIVSLKNDRGTRYDVYLEVYNEIKAAYNELWDEEALSRFGKPYDDLAKAEKDQIKAAIPFVIVESEPTDFGAPPTNEKKKGS